MAQLKFLEIVTRPRSVISVLAAAVVITVLLAGPVAGTVTEATTDGPPQATPGETISVSLTASADSPDISAVQIAPNEKPDHSNEFDATELVSAGADTQINDPGFIVYSELQDTVTVTWNLTVPADAEPGETLTLSGDVLNDANERTSFTYEVDVVNAAITEATVTAPDEAVAGDAVDITLETAAEAAIIDAVQIAPAEQPEHTNEFSELTLVDTGADTQVAEPGFIAYTDRQQAVTVQWKGTVPNNARVGDSITISGDVVANTDNRQSFSHTIQVIDDPVDKYRNEKGNVGDRGFINALSDWRNGEIDDITLIEVLEEYRKTN